MAAGAKITQFLNGRGSEETWSLNFLWVGTIKLYRSNWRASLVPAAAVIPAPVAHIIIAAVKMSVVDFRDLPWVKYRAQNYK